MFHLLSCPNLLLFYSSVCVCVCVGGGGGVTKVPDPFWKITRGYRFTKKFWYRPLKSFVQPSMQCAGDKKKEEKSSQDPPPSPSEFSGSGHVLSANSRIKFEFAMKVSRFLTLNEETLFYQTKKYRRTPLCKRYFHLP